MKTSSVAKKIANILRAMIKFVVGDHCPSPIFKPLKKKFTVNLFAKVQLQQRHIVVSCPSLNFVLDPDTLLVYLSTFILIKLVLSMD